MDAGLLPGDELLALDGSRLASEQTLDAAMASLRIGAVAELLIGRAGTVQRLTLSGRPDPRPRIAMAATELTELGRIWLRRETNGE